jgi:hypothetical protein
VKKACNAIYNFARGLSFDQSLEEMTPVLRNDYPHRSIIFSWNLEFQRRNFSLEEAPRSGRPASSVTENIAAVRTMLKSDRHVTYRQTEVFGHSCTGNSYHSARPPSSENSLFPLGTPCLNRGADGTTRFVVPQDAQ